MANADIYVAFGADTGGLEAAVALMNQQVKAAAKELNALAKEMQKTGAEADSDLGQKVKAAGVAVAGFKAEQAGLVAQLKTHAAGVEEVSHAHGANTGQIAESVHVLKAFADEIAAGQSPLRALAVEGGRVFQILSQGIPPVVQAYAGVGVAVLAVAGTLGYFAYEANAANAAAKGIQFDAALNQFNILSDASKELLAAVEKFGNVGAADARAFIEPFLQLGPAGEAISVVASQYLPTFIANGKSAKEAGDTLAKTFVEISRGSADVIRNSRTLSEEEKRQAETMLGAGDKAGAFVFALEGLRRSLGGLADDERKAKEASDASFQAMLSANLEVDDFSKAQENLGTAIAGATQRTREQEEELGRWLLKAAMAKDEAGRLASAMQDALKLDTVGASIKDLEGKVKEFQDQLGVAKDPESIKQLNTSLDIARDKLKKARDEAAGGLLGGSTLERIDQQNSLIEAQNQGSKSSQLRRELPALQDAANNPDLDAQAKQKAQEKVSLMLLKIRDTEFDEEKAQDDLRIAQAGKNSAEIVAIRQREVQRAIATYGEGNDKVIQAQKDLASAQEAAANAGSKASDKAARDALRGEQQSFDQQIAYAERTAQEKIKLYDLEAKAKQITEGEKLKLTLAALAQEKTAVDAAYASELALAGNSANKIEELQGKQKIFALEIAFAMQEAQEKAAIKTTQAWDSATKTINSAFDSQINGLLRGTTFWSQALKNTLATLTEDVAKFFVNWGLQAVENQAKQIILNSGLLASTVATTSAQTATVASAAAAQKGVNLTLIQGDAAKAAAAAYASAAEVPVVGWLVAPAAAAAAYAGTMAFASADIGMYDVPHDQMALIHHNELIMPAAEAGAFRDFLGSQARGGGGAAGGNNVSITPTTHLHVNAIDGASVGSWFRNNRREMMGAIDEAVRHGAHLGLRGLRA